MYEHFFDWFPFNTETTTTLTDKYVKGLITKEEYINKMNQIKASKLNRRLEDE